MGEFLPRLIFACSIENSQNRQNGAKMGRKRPAQEEMGGNQHKGAKADMNQTKKASTNDKPNWLLRDQNGQKSTKMASINTQEPGKDLDVQNRLK